VSRVAVILAAGRGTRLAGASRGRPKVLVEVGGRSLLSRSIANCAADEVVVVTGHQRAEVEAYIAASDWGMPVHCVHNPSYAHEGNARSLLVGLEAIDIEHDVLKVDGDLIVAPVALDALWAASTSAALIDTQAELDAEAMKAQLDGTRIRRLGKGLVEAQAESIGAELIAAADRQLVIEGLHETSRAQPSAYYEDAYDRLLRRGWRLGAMETATPWVEVDTPADLREAEAMVET